MNYYIGCDLGTSALKLTMIDENGNIIQSLEEKYPLLLPKPLFSEQNPLDWKKALLDGLKKISSGVDKNITALAIDGQMHGLVALDEKMNVIRNAILWNDSRSYEEVEYLNTTIGKEFLLKETGNIAYSGFTLPKILWMKKNEPDLFMRIRHVLLPKDYLNFVLTGKLYTDPSDAAGTLLYDVEKKCWSRKMIEISSLNESCYPDVIPCGQFIGTIQKEVLEELGWKNEVRVYQGAADNAAAAIANGTLQDLDCNLSLGTSGTIFIDTKKYVHSRNGAIHVFNGANEDYCILACMLSCASCLKWLNEEIYKTTDYVAEQKKISLSPSDKDSLYFLPYLMGERSPINDPKAKGVFLGLTMDTKRENMTKAILEGVSFAFKDSLLAIKEMGIDIKSAKVIGGGSQSEIWLQILSSVLNLPLLILEKNDGPSYGMALRCLASEKKSESLEEILLRKTKIKKTILPEKEIVDAYQKKYEVYKKIYPAIKNLF